MRTIAVSQIVAFLKYDLELQKLNYDMLLSFENNACNVLEKIIDIYFRNICRNKKNYIFVKNEISLEKI